MLSKFGIGYGKALGSEHADSMCRLSSAASTGSIMYEMMYDVGQG